jgi:N6-L-threonylcarbamoyladenine synthase
MNKSKPFAVLGIDTSCYTTSVCIISLTGDVLDNHQIILNVPEGQRGLRQSEAVFQHVVNMEHVFQCIDQYQLVAVACSQSPVTEAGSYMPVFKVGLNIGRVIAKALDVPLYTNSHQENHLAACFKSADVSPLGNFLVVHASGGTTDMLQCHLDGLQTMEITCIGQSKDIHVGQLFDRVGVAMGLPFPAGSEMEKLAMQAGDGYQPISAQLSGCSINLSGAEKQAFDLIESGVPKQQVALAVYKCVSRVFERWILQAIKQTNIDTVVLMGGVASSGMIRSELKKRVENYKKARLFFAEPQFSRDNALGTALIGLSKYRETVRDN